MIACFLRTIKDLDSWNFFLEAGMEKKRGTLSRLKNIMTAVVRIAYEELMHC
jgi:hypothetical protein